MANLRYILPNELRVRVQRLRTTTIAIGTAVSAVGVMYYNSFLISALAMVGCVLVWNSQRKRLSGAEGEERALGLPQPMSGSLVELPENYTLFNNVRVLGNRGPRELDLVAVGPNGVFVIEVKHYRGEIGGNENDPKWRQIKQSQRGNNYLSAIRNPVSQVRGAALALKEHLKRQGVHAWIEGIVVFTHPECALHVGQTSVPVLTLPALASHIRQHVPRFRPCPPSLVVRALSRMGQTGLGAMRTAKHPA